MKRKRKTPKEVKQTKNEIMTLLSEKHDIVPASAEEIGRRPPYMYTCLCPDPKYRR